MKIQVNGLTIESDDPANVIRSAIKTFGDNPELETIRMWALEYLNVWRGLARESFGLTNAVWQDLCYTGKALEAQRWLLARDTAFGLSDEATAREITNEDMANLVMTQWSAWQKASGLVEAAYFVKQRDVKGATTIDEIVSVLIGEF